MEKAPKRKLIQILVPVFIILVIAGIWIYKNSGDSELISPVDEGELALAADSIDLELLVSYGLPIIIDFGADYCAPCRQMEPVLKAIHKEMQGRAIIKYVDVVEYSQVAREFPIQVIPTQLFINSDGSAYVPSKDIGIEFEMYNYQGTDEHAYTAHLGGLTEDQMRTILADMGVEE